MNSRRGFVRKLAGLLAGSAAVAATLDPEKDLWIPGKKKIFLPSPKIKVFVRFPVVRSYPEMFTSYCMEGGQTLGIGRGSGLSIHYQIEERWMTKAELDNIIKPLIPPGKDLPSLRFVKRGDYLSIGYVGTIEKIPLLDYS